MQFWIGKKVLRGLRNLKGEQDLRGFGNLKGEQRPSGFEKPQRSLNHFHAALHEGSQVLASKQALGK